ncbi:mRNA capping enzyme, catalytic domain-containing protein [Scenedesmus sp. NREL 46B-D3]|nr:mRNA capping enzyme, catalytic domain-containing protein [Scenedesmus sp. NREL 46B-D3]
MARAPPYNPIPPGWFDCPDIGEVSTLHHMIPMKVPLGNSHRNPHMESITSGQWTPLEALTAAHHKIVDVDKEGQVGMVLDLSNSDRYYDPGVITANCVRYVKVPCRGRGVSPDPLAVNMAVWEIRKALAVNKNFYILVHCTHGFNRSGFIIVCAAMRLLADKGYCVERGIRYFREQRTPGIYKHEYINDLFNLEACDDEDEDERLGYNMNPAQLQAAAAHGRMTHSDKVGEPVCLEEARYYINTAYDILAGQDNMLRGLPFTGGYPHESMAGRGPGDLFMGSQPVSLDLDNLDLVRSKRYFVTWKADGTRYLMLLTREGVYLIDRAGEVRRMHMRFPTLLQQQQPKGAHPVGPPHHWTLLDGEMVVDDIEMAGDKQRRRFLVYDCMMLAGEGISDLRFELTCILSATAVLGRQDRYQIVDKQVMRPVALEKDHYMRHPNPKFLYDWSLEVCSVRRKEFWPLFKARKLLEQFIPTLCHESDGLILQVGSGRADDALGRPYIQRTYPHLLKWKFRHMNSVDFKLAALPGQPPKLLLNCATRRKHGNADINHLSLQDIGLGEQRLEFPADVDPTSLHGKVIECSFDVERRTWLYMRDRPDKLTANHRSVFDKVMTSISDNITEEVLLNVFDEALQSDIYTQEQDWIKNPQPAKQQQQAAPEGADAEAEQQAKPPVLHQQQQQQQQTNELLHQEQHHHKQGQLQQQHSQQQQQQQQRQQMPEVQQQQFSGQGMQGPSPILTPPPGLTAQELQQQQQQNGHHTAAAGDGFADDDMPGTGEGHVAVDHSAYGLMGGVGNVGDLGALGDHDNMEQQDDDDDGGDGGGSDYRVTEAGDGEGSDGNYNDMELEDQGAAMEEEQF